MAFDGDEAGQKAMDRAALVALSLGMNPKVVVLPEGVDPADYIKENGVDAWKDRLKESKHFIEHHLVLIKAHSHSPHVFVKTIKEKLFPFLARVSSGMERTLYIKKISEEIGMKEEVISEELKKVSPTPTKQVESVSKQPTDSTPYERLTGLRQRFGSEELEKHAEALSALSAGDIVFSAPPIEEDRLQRALIIVENDYGDLSADKHALVAKELVEKVTQDFLSSARVEYAKQLKEAEKISNEEEVSRLSTILEEITKRRHTSPPS